jgi:hypothetical protein
MPVESTLLGAEGYTQNQRAIEEPWVRCFTDQGCCEYPCFGGGV